MPPPPAFHMSLEIVYAPSVSLPNAAEVVNDGSVQLPLVVVIGAEAVPVGGAEAVAVGPHVRTVKIGDTVLFNPEDRFEVEVHGEEYVILRERDIHAIASTRNDTGTGLYL